VTHIPLTRPRLLVIRWSVSHETATTRGAWSMPSAPFGTPAWQLPTVAAHLARLHRTQSPPTVDAFAAYLAERGTRPVPVPLDQYNYDPLHDTRISTLVDVHTEPAQGGEQWPRCSLAVLEQETGRCPWSRISRHRAAYGVITAAHREMTAESQRLADRHRSRPSDATAAALALAEQVRDWTGRAHRAVRAEQTLIRAGQARPRARQERRSVAVLRS
jgi:hypothetical protein